MKYSKSRLFIFLKQKSSLLLFLIGITASLMALRGINQYFYALIRHTKTKFLTSVTSNTDESHGQGGFGTVKYIALIGISLPKQLIFRFFERTLFAKLKKVLIVRDYQIRLKVQLLRH